MSSCSFVGFFNLLSPAQSLLFGCSALRGHGVSCFVDVHLLVGTDTENAPPLAVPARFLCALFAGTGNAR